MHDKLAAMAESALSLLQKTYAHSIISSGSSEDMPGDVTPCCSSRKLLVAGAASFALCIISVVVWLGLRFLLQRLRWRRSSRLPQEEERPKPGGSGGLNTAAIALLPSSFPYRRGNPGPETECAVCLDVLDEGQMARQLPGCMHVFHQQCVDAWLATNASCPVCRRRADPAQQAEEEPTASVAHVVAPVEA